MSYTLGELFPDQSQSAGLLLTNLGACVTAITARFANVCRLFTVGTHRAVPQGQTGAYHSDGFRKYTQQHRSACLSPICLFAPQPAVDGSPAMSECCLPHHSCIHAFCVSAFRDAARGSLGFYLEPVTRHGASWMPAESLRDVLCAALCRLMSAGSSLVFSGGYQNHQAFFETVENRGQRVAGPGCFV